MFKDHRQAYEALPESEQAKVLELVRETLGDAREGGLTESQVKDKLGEAVTAATMKVHPPRQPGQVGEPVKKGKDGLPEDMTEEGAGCSGTSGIGADNYAAFAGDTITPEVASVLSKRPKGSGRYFGSGERMTCESRAWAPGRRRGFASRPGRARSTGGSPDTRGEHHGHQNDMRLLELMGSRDFAPAANQASDKFGMLAGRLEQAALGALGSAIRAAGGSNQDPGAEGPAGACATSLVAASSMSAAWFDGARRVRVQASAKLPVADGKVSLDMKGFMASAAEVAPRAIAAAQEKTYDVDAALLRARRVGDGVLLSHPHLPEWGMQVGISEVKADRADAERPHRRQHPGASKAASFYRNAKIVGALAMPVVASEAPAQAPAAVEPAPEPVTASLAADVQAMESSMPTARDSAQKAVSTGLGRLRPLGRCLRGLRCTLTCLATRAALAFAAKKAPGSMPSAKSVDLSGMGLGGQTITGSALVSVEYYVSAGRDQMTVEVPFDPAGRVVAAKVGQTQADILAGEEIRRRLEIASEADAKAIFDRFVADQAKVPVLASGETGYGSTWVNRGPVGRVPIAKTALPAEYSVVGKKILLAGYVYEVQPTDYNAPSIARAAHWMLELRADLPASKAGLRLQQLRHGRGPVDRGHLMLPRHGVWAAEVAGQTSQKNFRVASGNEVQEITLTLYPDQAQAAGILVPTRPRPPTRRAGGCPCATRRRRTRSCSPGCSSRKGESRAAGPSTTCRRPPPR